MSTFSQNVQKVKDAFSKIKTALQSKGVTVPDDAKLSGVPALVEECGVKPVYKSVLVYADGTETTETTDSGVVRLTYRFAKSEAVTFRAYAEESTEYSKSANSLFASCQHLSSISLPEGFGAAVTDMSYMFYYCTSLASLTLPEGFGAAVTDTDSMFNHCSKLTTINAPEGVVLEDDGSNGILRMKTSFDLSDTSLDKDSLIRVIKSLQTVSSTQTLTLGTSLKAKLEGDAAGEAALALAAEKNWAIA